MRLSLPVCARYTLPNVTPTLIWIVVTESVGPLSCTGVTSSLQS